MLNISGTCIPQQASVKCKFGTDPHAVITEGIVVNSMLARCPVPRLTQRGDTEISFSVGGQDFRHKSTITGKLVSSYRVNIYSINAQFLMIFSL